MMQTGLETEEAEVGEVPDGYIPAPHEKPYQYQEGEYTVTRGAGWSGPGCHLGCGVLLYTDKEGKLVKVEGDPENPYNQGRLCMRCLTLPEVVYSPERLMHPLKRAREDRGKDKFVEISWDEAFDTVENTFNEIKEKYGAESIFFSQGTGRDCAAYITRLAWSFGSPNYTSFFSGFSCFVPRCASLAATTGTFWLADNANQFQDRWDNPRYEVPRVLFVWGNYPMRSNSDGYYGHALIDLMQRGTQVVMIDPKITWLSTRSILHLRVRPGTDGALALGMLNVLINEDLYDHEFVEYWCYGFDELAERVQEYTVDKVSEITWVPEDQIREAAHLLGENKPAALQWGVAIDQTKGSTPAALAMVALFQITGNIENPGGMISPPEILNYAGGWGHELLSDEQEAKRIGLDKYPLLQFGFKFGHGDSLYETIKTGKPYAMHAGWFQQNNTLACMTPQPEDAIKTFGKLDFIVCIDLFKTPTIMALADIVMPTQTFPERDGIRLGDGVQRAEAINKVITVGECKSDMEINLELGHRWNPEAWPWKNVREMYTYMLEDTGMNFETVRANAPVYLPFEYYKHEKGLLRPDGQVGFSTATGRIELWSTFFANIGLDPLPYFEEPSPGPGATPEMMEEYPFVLMTGARNWSMFHSEHRNIPRLRAAHPDPTIQVNDKALKKLGIEPGSWVRVENHLGKCKARIEATPVLPETMASIDHGWWLPEADPENLYDILDVSSGNLLEWGCGKSGFGANYKSTICKITQLEEDEAL